METINVLILISMILVCLYPIKNFMIGRSEFLEFPLLVSLTIMGWFLPQYIAEFNNDQIPKEAILKAGFMAFLCFLSVMIGYYLYKPKMKPQRVEGNLEKLKIRLAIWSLILLVPLYMFNKLPEEEIGAVWSGPAVAYLFFYSAIKYTFVYAYLLWLGGDKSKKILLVLGIGIVYYFFLIVLGGRRTDSVELFFILTGGLFFIKNIRVSKIALLIASIVFSLFMASISDYRGALTSKTQNKFEQLLNIDWADNFLSTFITTGGEVQNFIIAVYVRDESGNFDYGSIHWNNFINRFIPRQLLGQEIKDSLKFDIINSQKEFEEFGHEKISGQTNTGLCDAFCSFWYFGCLEYLLIGIAYKYLYVRACQGVLKNQMVYLFLLGSGLISITHETDWPLFAFIHLWIFTLPYKKYASFFWPKRV